MKQNKNELKWLHDVLQWQFGSTLLNHLFYILFIYVVQNAFTTCDVHCTVIVLWLAYYFHVTELTKRLCQLKYTGMLLIILYSVEYKNQNNYFSITYEFIYCLCDVISWQWTLTWRWGSRHTRTTWRCASSSTPPPPHG